MADLTIGCECGGSDGTSGLAGNPVVGAFFDRLVDAGGTAIFEEIVEMIGLRDIILRAALADQSREQLQAAYDKADAIAKPSGNIQSRPATSPAALPPSKKEHGCIRQERSRPIQGVVKVASDRRRTASGSWTVCRTTTSCSSATPTPTTLKASWT